MSLDLDALERTAQAATPGPWEVTPNGEVKRGVIPPDEIWKLGATGNRIRRDAAHIAAFNPQVALALVARVREAEALLDAVKDTNEHRLEMIKRATLAEAAIDGRDRTIAALMRGLRNELGAGVDHNSTLGAALRAGDVAAVLAALGESAT